MARILDVDEMVDEIMRGHCLRTIRCGGLVTYELVETRAGSQWEYRPAFMMAISWALAAFRQRYSRLSPCHIAAAHRAVAEVQRRTLRTTPRFATLSSLEHALGRLTPVGFVAMLGAVHDN